MVNGNLYGGSLPITVQYSDSAQEVVTLSLSALPANITMDTTWITSGIPTFNTTITLLDTTLDGATPGTYPMTLTAVGATTGKRTYPFKIKIIAEPSCSANITGKYLNCYSYCTTVNYTDSVYADPVTPNKIWFTNVSNTGSKIYAKYNCSTQQLSVPAQLIGGTTYSGTGSAYYSLTTHHISLNLISSTNSCSVNMN